MEFRDNWTGLPNVPTVASTKSDATIYLCSSVPWNMTYSHVRLFNSQEDAKNYCESMAKFIDRKATPVSMGEASVSIPHYEILAQDCNYICFNNTPYEQPSWHFAFITDVIPTSVNSSKIKFSVDYWQENIYRAKLNPCFVERRIVRQSEDSPGDFTFPEQLETGDYNINSVSYYPSKSEPWKIVLSTTFELEGQPAEGRLQNNIYNALAYYAWDDAKPANDFIGAITKNNKINGVVDCFMYPSSWFNNDDGKMEFDIQIDGVTKIDGYTPKNKKLLTYPYVGVYVNNGHGNDITYKYEYFPDRHATFKLTTFLFEPNAVVMPTGYQVGVQNNSISLDYFPRCAIAVDSYKAYLAQKGGSIGLSGLGTAGEFIGGVAQMFMGQKASGLATIGNSAMKGLGLLNQTNVASTMPNTTRFSNSTQVNVAAGYGGFLFAKLSIRQEYAKKIDDYFSTFGYRIGRIEGINMHARRSWDYVKTIDCNITGQLDVDSNKILSDIFNNGVTIWHTNDVGNYNVDNGDA